MRILGVDYGRKKLGLALAETAANLATPFCVLNVGGNHEALKKIKETVEKEEVEKIVIGVSEGEMAKESIEFGGKLKEILNIPVDFYNETLSTLEAQELSIEAGMGPKKRREMEDAFAATVILQDYLDSQA